ncbi:unnamed protein product [Sphagnum balticum]
MRSSQEEDTCAAGHASLGSLFSLEFLISAFADKYWELVTNESLDGPALSVSASYGAFVKPMPFTNELRIQMLIGVVMYVQNFSRHYNFVAHCCICGEMQVVRWNGLGRSTCSCSSFTQGPSTVTLSGPLWTALSTMADIQEMIEMATSAQLSADQKLLDIMIEESDPNLQVSYIALDELSKRNRVSNAKMGTSHHSLAGGYSTCQSHIASNAIKTSAPMCHRVEITRSLMQ